MHPASIHAGRLSHGRFLFPEHVGLEWHEAASGVEAAQLGDGGVVLSDPVPLGDGQAVAAAQKIRWLRFARGQQGVEDGPQALAGKVS